LAKLVDEATLARVKFLMDGRRYRPRPGDAAPLDDAPPVGPRSPGV